MVEERTLELDIPLVLPGVEDERDRCLERLLQDLSPRKGILRVHLHRETDPVTLCVHYDPMVLGLADVQRTALRAGAAIVDRFRHEVIPLEGLDCSDCALVVEHSVARLEGVLNAKVSYVAQTVHVEYDSQLLGRRAIEARIRSLGYRIPLEGMRGWLGENRKLLTSLLAGFFLLAGWLTERTAGVPPAISLALYAAAYLAGGLESTWHALQALIYRHLNTDLLMSIAALGAAALGEYAEGALLLTLFSLGHALEDRALDKARSAVKALAGLSPKMAAVREGERERQVAVEELRIEDLVVVKPGERFPIDGEVIEGESAVDQSPVTGESLPVHKGPSDVVFAGCLNGEGALLVKATRLARDSTMARVMALAERAQVQKSSTQRATERFMGIFVPAVLLADALLIAIPPIFGIPFRTSFLRAMTLLVAASPCALALGTPAATLAGIARAARSGVLIKGGVHLESLGELDAMAFDKTGTLTQGEPRVREIIALEGAKRNDVLAVAAALEAQANHPLGRAILRYVEGLNLDRAAVRNVSAHPGGGIEGQWKGEQVLVGNLEFFEMQDWSVPDAARAQVKEFEGQGKTAILVGASGALMGVVSFADPIRPEAEAVVRELRTLGVAQTFMLTGDNPQVGANVGSQLGVTDVRAELSPEDKLEAVAQLVQGGRSVAMVGDGVNDAPALARATVGVALGGAGSDAALEAADVVIMADDLTRLPFAVNLSRATVQAIRQNLGISLGVMILLAILALSGSAGIGGAILIHEGSTLLVAFNALRLLSHRDPARQDWH